MLPACSGFFSGFNIILKEKEDTFPSSMTDESVEELQERLELLQLETAVVRAKIDLANRRSSVPTRSSTPTASATSSPAIRETSFAIGDLVSITNPRQGANLQDTFGHVIRLTKSRVHIRTQNGTVQRAPHNVTKIDRFPNGIRYYGGHSPN